MTIEIIAHRGASRERRENTLPAFRRALELGADAIELDVHATRDGVVVVRHDPTVADAASRPIAAASLAELRTLTGTFDDPAYVPTLAEVITLVAGRARIYVEVKAQEITRQVLDVIAGLDDRVALHAFDHRIAREAGQLRRSLATGILSSSYVLDPAAALRAAGARDYWQHASLIDQALVDAVHDAGGRVVAWTVNAPDQARELATLGVDGLCSDVPDIIRGAVELAIA